MSAKSTMEELRELNVRRQREAQQPEQPTAAAPAPDGASTNEQMINLSNDNVNDNSFTHLNELSNDHAHTRTNTSSHENIHTPAHEGMLVPVKEPSSKQPPKAKGRAGQKSALSATDRLFAQVTREPIMRLNIELTENLHARLKEYCVQHKVPIRMLVTALIEDFFAQETEGT